MKKVLPSLLFILNAGISIAQPGEWVWIKGSNMVNDPGVYGVQGVSNPANNPPSLYEACEWTDQNGNFWLYGGLGVNFQEYNDIWKYDPSTNEWTWMKGTGSGGGLPTYGTMGVPSATNDPGGRAWGTASWVDNAGNFWLYGGKVAGMPFSDLWRYEPSTNNWTWMKGLQFSGSSGVYGTQGVPDTANLPACRWETAATWTDNAGDLWLFGGINFSGGGRNDLWRYHISTNEWTWMKGSMLIGAPEVYGMQCIENPANTPGGRVIYSHWKDLNGNFWIFGGSDSGTDFNDLWRYNPVTNNWTWFKGGSGNGSYGTKCLPELTNIPGARIESRTSVTDGNGDLWLFGGGLGSNFQITYNDLWKYCISTNKWTWVSGDNYSNPAGSRGTLGVSSPFNMPDARGGALMWTDQNGHLYLFGGSNNAWPATYNDLWKFTIDPLCAPCSSQPTALFTAPNQICPGTCTDFTNTSLGSTSFQWNFQGGNPSTSTLINPTNICYSISGSYDVTLIAFNGAGNDTLTYSNYINVFPTPPPQAIFQSGDTLFANAGAASYQWYENGNNIPGATGYFYVATESGDYNVVAIDANGCEVEAAIFDVIAEINQLSVGGLQFAIYPNPVSDILEIKYLNIGDHITVIIYNNLGEKIFEKKDKIVTPDLTIGLKQIPAGIYHLEISNEKYSLSKLFSKL